MLEAIFTTGVDEITVSGLTQWDRGQILRVSYPDMPTIYQVHFTFRGGKEALIVHVLDGETSNDVAIPDELLMQPHDLIAYVYLFDSDSTGETVKTIHLPLVRRAKPEDYTSELTPTQAQRVDAMLAEFKTIVTDAENAAAASQKAAENSASASALSATSSASSATAAKNAQNSAEKAVNNANIAIEEANAAVEKANEAYDDVQEFIAGEVITIEEIRAICV